MTTIEQNEDPALSLMLEFAGLKPTDLENGELFPKEIFWRDHQPWLKQRGYLLRPRYQPGWVGSWLNDSSKLWLTSEDAKPMKWGHLLDATSVKDGSQVMLKKIKPSEHPAEVKICQMFSKEPLISDVRNRCAPVIEVLDVPNEEDLVIIVMPYLQNFDNPPFKTIGEVVDFFSQMFMGLQFMHSGGFAHRDIKVNNIMVDARPLYPNPPHPHNHNRRLDFADYVTPTSRTLVPVKYYFIDFGISRRYTSDASRLEPPWGAGDRTIPEFSKGELCDSYAVDIYCLGNIIREQFLEGHFKSLPKRGFGFMKELVADMVQDNAKSRPTIDEVVKRFEKIRRGLSFFALRSRCTDGAEPTSLRTIRGISHWTTQLSLAVQRVPAIPTLSKPSK